MQPLPVSLPRSLALELEGRTWAEVGLGKSAARVLRFAGGLYLKTVIRDAMDPVHGGLEPERARLAWLDGLLPVPRVLHFEQDSTRDYLLMSEIPGADALVRSATLAPSRLATLLADACRAFHSVRSSGCPFEASVDTLIAAARARLEAGRVDTGDFDPIRRGRDPHELFAEVLALRPRDEERVVCHGDFCLANVLVDDDRCSGFVDLGRMGVGDRHLDLALCQRSLSHRVGPEPAEAFLEAYGTPYDAARIHFFVLLDEFL